MRQTLTRILLTLALLTTQHYAESYQTQDLSVPLYPDVSREGWHGGLGIGGHITSFDFNGYDGFDSEGGIATSIKIGYNFTEQISLEYIRNASWYTLSNDTFISGLSGIGATYYFLPQQETWYAGLALGLGDFVNLDDKGSETGSAFMATVGYEFAPHWQAEAVWMTTSITDSYDDTLDTSSVQILLNYSWY